MCLDLLDSSRVLSASLSSASAMISSSAGAAERQRRAPRDNNLSPNFALNRGRCSLKLSRWEMGRPDGEKVGDRFIDRKYRLADKYGMFVD